MSLSARINSMKFEFAIAAGHDAEVLLLPRTQGIVKLFAEDLVDEVGDEAGSPAYVYHCLWTAERDMEFCGLRVELHDGDDLAMQ